MCNRCQIASVFFMKLRNAYILSGGKSSRMGQDKLFLEVAGKFLLKNTVSVCREIFERVVIVAKEKEKFEEFGCEVLLDLDGAQGPMAGIITALTDCSEDKCFITAADFRDLSSSIIHSLLKEYNGEQYLGLAESEYAQPLCGIYKKSSLEFLLASASQNNYGLQEAVRKMDRRLIPICEKKWRNINTPEDTKG